MYGSPFAKPMGDEPDAGSVGEQIGQRIFFLGGCVEGTENLGLDVGGEPTSFAGTGDHLAGDEFGGGVHHVTGLEIVFVHERPEGLLTKIAFDIRVHGGKDVA